MKPLYRYLIYILATLMQWFGHFFDKKVPYPQIEKS
jgi:hypothetical protein